MNIFSNHLVMYDSSGVKQDSIRAITSNQWFRELLRMTTPSSMAASRIKYNT